jgi:Ca-activated chloride channel family protein
MLEREDYYADLGVERDASPEDIRRAYHKAARRLHPDVNVEAGATELFLRIQTAYEVLSDPDRRTEYDKRLPSSEKEAPPIQIHTTYSRPSLIRLEEQQLIYVLVEISAPAGSKARPSPPLNICLVLDRSTSMQGERMDTVKSTAIELVRQLRPQDTFSIVTFSDRAEVLASSGQRADPKDLEAKIQKIQTGGGTEIFRGLEAGFLQVRSKYSGSHINHIILLTDGRTYGDEPACLRIADQAAVYGIGISGLGIGDEWNDSFLDTLAARTGGSSLYISRTSDIKQFLTQKVNAFGQVYAERVALDLSLKLGVDLQYAFRLSPDANPLPLDSPMRLGVIPKDAPLTFLLEFKVAPLVDLTPVYSLASAKLTFDIPVRSSSGYALDLHFTRSVSSAPKVQPPPTKLLKAISRLTLYRMQESAHQDLVVGENESASRYLQNLATHLFSYGEHDLARTAMQEAQNIENNLGLSEIGKKQIKYGTRALLLPASVIDPDSMETAGGQPL